MLKTAIKKVRGKYEEVLREFGRRNASIDAGRIRSIIKMCQELLDPLEEELDAEKDKSKSEKEKESITEQGNIDALINTWDDWAGSFTNCVSALSGKPGITDPESLCAWIEHEATGKWPAEESAKEAVKQAKAEKPDLAGLREAILAHMESELDFALESVKSIPYYNIEEGDRYPSEAYAYAPDPVKPSSWKLRIWESIEEKVTRNQLQKAVASLSPGGLSGVVVEIPEEKLSEVKRKIREAYRELDFNDEEMPRWILESKDSEGKWKRDLSRTLIADYVPLTEAEISGKGVASITVIKPGLNATKERYYPRETLARDYGVFEGVKMYADHPTEREEKERPERSVRDWVATLKNVHMTEEGAIAGEAVVIEDWMQQRLAQLRDKELLSEMGISINAIGTATRGEADGAKTNIIERIVKARSVDFVTEPGAGGGIQFYESDSTLDIDLIGMEVLRERRPDLVKDIETSLRSTIIKEVKQVSEQEQKIKELEGQVETLTTERDEALTKITEAEKAKAIAETKAKLDEALDKAALPDPAKERILERFKDAASDEGIAEAISAEKNYILKLQESGKVKNLGGGDPPEGPSEEEQKESWKALHPEWTDEQIAVAMKG